MQSGLRTLVFGFILVGLVGSTSAGEPFLYAGDNYAGTLFTIDKSTGATIDTVGVTLDGSPVASIKGLAARESTGVLYAVVVKDSPVDQPPVGDFTLVTIVPDTGVATEIGPLGDRFAGLAWAPYAPTEGQPPWVETLFGVTGDGAINPEELYIIDPDTAATSFHMSLGNGADGEAIAYNSDDNLLYHLSGGYGFDLVFEKIDLWTLDVTPVALSGASFVNGNGLVYDQAAGVFRFAAIVENPQPTDQLYATELFSVSAVGVAASLGATDTYFSGMAFSELVPVELMSFTIE